jgi:hypothetical protein
VPGRAGVAASSARSTTFGCTALLRFGLSDEGMRSGIDQRRVEASKAKPAIAMYQTHISWLAFRLLACSASREIAIQFRHN